MEGKQGSVFRTEGSGVFQSAFEARAGSFQKEIRDFPGDPVAKTQPVADAEQPRIDP